MKIKINFIDEDKPNTITLIRVETIQYSYDMLVVTFDNYESAVFKLSDINSFSIKKEV